MTPGTGFFIWSPGTGGVWWVITGGWLAGPAWLAPWSRAEGGSWEIEGAAFCKVYKCPVEATEMSKGAAPAADSENQVLSQGPGLFLHCCSAPCTAAGTGHLPPQFPQPPCGLVSCHPPLHFRFPYPLCVTHIMLCLSFSFQSDCATHISFLLPPSSLASGGQAGSEGCARMYQIAGNVWLIGMTMEVPRSDTANKGQCPLVIPVFCVNPLGASLWCIGCSLTFWHCMVYHNTAEVEDFSLPWDRCMT